MTRGGPVLAALLLASGALARGEKVAWIRIDRAIGPATAGYVARALKVADVERAECLVIQLDTPGGLLESTKEIVQSFYSAALPVVVYVAPEGAHATSAGCFITLAADVAAMAPHTGIGAAHPVSIGGGGGEQKVDDVMKQKMENFAASYIETIAERHNRNAEWARSAVRESASITAEKALELNVIEIIAQDREDLLKQLDGRKAKGRALKTAAATVMPIPMVARERVFQTLWRPEVLFVLMLIAMYGIIGELSNPGAILPGVAGAIALILALYMGSVLPVNIAGIALIVLAIALFIADVFATTHGVLTVGGIISFAIGGLMLFDRAGPAFRLSLVYIIPAALLTAAFFLFVVGAGLRAQWLPVRAGKETLVGKTVPAATPINKDSGRVFIEGEYWNATSESPVAEGQPVQVVAVEGLTLRVKPNPQEGA
ncbi:MAG: nodulation protein NfeD [Verrucomicrobia subdivision 3 bacterium]|nr:nodulation protein NfeD [Limisphaerales bacterium]